MTKTFVYFSFLFIYCYDDENNGGVVMIMVVVMSVHRTGSGTRGGQRTVFGS